jgi:hypothetical protein
MLNYCFLMVIFRLILGEYFENLQLMRQMFFIDHQKQLHIYQKIVFCISQTQMV